MRFAPLSFHMIKGCCHAQIPILFSLLSLEDDSIPFSFKWFDYKLPQRSLCNEFLDQKYWRRCLSWYNWIFVLWLEPAINTYWRTEHTLVHWVLKSDSGYYVVVDLQQNHLNYELLEEELIEFEMLRLMVLQTVINTKSKSFPRDVGIKRCSTDPQAFFYSRTSISLAK